MQVGRIILAGLALVYCSLLPAQGSDQCLACHANLEHSLAHLAYADKQKKKSSPAASAAGDTQHCVSCHGDSVQHAQRPKQFSPAIVFGPESGTSPDKQNQQCLGCHKASLGHWQASMHEHAGLSCASCHRSHELRDPILQRSNQVPACIACHAQIRSELHLPSRHPIVENKTICTDCHKPHGGLGEFALNEPGINETCFGCHAEKRGPFLFEHSPASENCDHCHKPHGSINPALLRARTPFLCQQCHSVAFHPSVAPSGSGLPGGQPSASLLGKDCMNCHNQVHGSNHPSGPSLMR